MRGSASRISVPTNTPTTNSASSIANIPTAPAKGPCGAASRTASIVPLPLMNDTK